ncbi:MAG: TIGR00725 family protein [Deltaproteobacteria bacterium]|nr:TIGR00725 family protein [Deltaproteobacteria bacterium]
MTRRPLQAVVIGSGDAPPQACQDAERLGAMLAQRGVVVVTGGGSGIMAAASKGASEAGGVVVGILPGDRVEGANRWCTVAIPTGMGHGRNALTALAGDLVVVVGGAAGTLSEVSLAWIHGRPILALTAHGGWSARLGGQAVDDQPRAPIVACPTLADLEREVDAVLAG